MPKNMVSSGNSRESRIKDAILSGDGKTGGPFGKADRMAVKTTAPLVRKLVTDAVAQRILDGK